MAITYVGSNSNTSGAGTLTTIDASLPGSIAVNDLIVIAVAQSAEYTASLPSGYTRVSGSPFIDTGATAGVQGTLDVFYKFATTTSEVAPTFTWGTALRVNTMAAVYRGVDTASPFDAQAAQIKISSSTAWAATALTNADATAWGVYAVIMRQLTTPITFAPPSGMTERLDVDAGFGGNANVASEWADTAGPAATGTITYSATSSGASGNGVSWSAFLNPGPTVPVNYSATPADAAAGSDAATAGLSFTRSAADVGAGADTVTALLTKGAADVAAGADATIRVSTLARAQADTAGGTDAVSSSFAKSDITEYQFVIAESVNDALWMPFGFGQTVVVEKFDNGVAETRDQDVLSPVADVRYFGTDRRTPPSWSFDLYTDVTNHVDALAWAALFEAVWDREDVRSTPGAVVPLRYALPGRIRRVYGRPRNFAPIAGSDTARTGRLHMVADFTLADNTYYEDAAQTVTARMIPPQNLQGGYTFPITFPMTNQTPSGVRNEQIIVGGTRPTWVDLKFFGPCVDPWVQIGNYRWGLRGSLSTGQNVLMSGVPWRQGLLRNDGAWVPGMLDPRARLSQLRLPPGTYTASLGGYAQSSTAKCEIAWRAAYGTM